MRNYFKMQAIHYHLTSMLGQSDVFAWGGSDTQLLSNVLRAQAEARAIFGPTTTFTLVTGPAVVYWELNQENFGTILNFNPGNIWGGTHLPPVVTAPVSDTFYGMTLLQSEGSPRKTWSHGH